MQMSFQISIIDPDLYNHHSLRSILACITNMYFIITILKSLATFFVVGKRFLFTLNENNIMLYALFVYKILMREQLYKEHIVLISQIFRSCCCCSLGAPDHDLNLSNLRNLFLLSCQSEIYRQKNIDPHITPSK